MSTAQTPAQGRGWSSQAPSSSAFQNSLQFVKMTIPATNLHPRFYLFYYLCVCACLCVRVHARVSPGMWADVGAESDDTGCLLGSTSTLFPKAGRCLFNPETPRLHLPSRGITGRQVGFLCGHQGSEPLTLAWQALFLMSHLPSSHTQGEKHLGVILE